MANVNNAQQVIKELRQVRQIRQYQPDPVPENLVTELLEVARWSGSASNTQPWHFIVIADKDELRQLSEIRPAINWVAGAPLAIALVFDGDNPRTEWFDEGRVSERLLIAADLLGLGAGTAWYGDDSQQQRAKELLGIPAAKSARSLVTIGYPVTSNDPRSGPAAHGRKPLRDLVSQNRYGTGRE